MAIFGIGLYLKGRSPTVIETSGALSRSSPRRWKYGSFSGLPVLIFIILMSISGLCVAMTLSAGLVTVQYDSIMTHVNGLPIVCDSKCSTSKGIHLALWDCIFLHCAIEKYSNLTDLLSSDVLRRTIDLDKASRTFPSNSGNSRPVLRNSHWITLLTLTLSLDVYGLCSTGRGPVWTINSAFSHRETSFYYSCYILLCSSSIMSRYWLGFLKSLQLYFIFK